MNDCDKCGMPYQGSSVCLICGSPIRGAINKKTFSAYVVLGCLLLAAFIIFLSCMGVK